MVIPEYLATSQSCYPHQPANNANSLGLREENYKKTKCWHVWLHLIHNGPGGGEKPRFQVVHRWCQTMAAAQFDISLSQTRSGTRVICGNWSQKIFFLMSLGTTYTHHAAEAGEIFQIFLKCRKENCPARKKDKKVFSGKCIDHFTGVHACINEYFQEFPSRSWIFLALGLQGIIMLHLLSLIQMPCFVLFSLFGRTKWRVLSRLGGVITPDISKQSRDSKKAMKVLLFNYMNAQTNKCTRTRVACHRKQIYGCILKPMSRRGGHEGQDHRPRVVLSW